VYVGHIGAYGSVLGHKPSKYRPILWPWFDDPYRLREQQRIKERGRFIDGAWFREHSIISREAEEPGCHYRQYAEFTWPGA